jgi:hypothetical protein
MTLLAAPPFQDRWRRQKSAAFDLSTNSTAGQVQIFDLWNRPVQIGQHGVAGRSFQQKIGYKQCSKRCPDCSLQKLSQLQHPQRPQPVLHGTLSVFDTM